MLVKNVTLGFSVKLTYKRKSTVWISGLTQVILSAYSERPYSIFSIFLPPIEKFFYFILYKLKFFVQLFFSVLKWVWKRRNEKVFCLRVLISFYSCKKKIQDKIDFGNFLEAKNSAEKRMPNAKDKSVTT